MLDSNILVYAADSISPYHKESMKFRDQGAKGEVAACLCTTVLNEFHAIVTDPNRVENPLTYQQALKELNQYRKAFVIYYPTEEVLDELTNLLKKHEITSQKVFDSFIVATMLANGIKKIYTANQNDFEKFEEIEVDGPEEIPPQKSDLNE